MPVDVYTTTIAETGEVIIDRVVINDPAPRHAGRFLLEKTYNRHIHGPPENLAHPQLPTANLMISFGKQHQAYRKNLRILYQEFCKKIDARALETGDMDKVLRRAGDYVCNGALKLENSVADMAPEKYREGYLTDIFQYWRKVASRKEIKEFEDVWEYVAGRPHREE